MLTVVCDRVNENVGVAWGWVNSLLAMFKDYFDVTNQYVVQKMQIILVPFTVKVSAQSEK